MHEIIDPEEDLAYFHTKLDECLKHNDVERCDKLRKQVELLEDSILIYRLHHPRRKTQSKE